MKTKELIKELQELDPSGEMDMTINASCYDYPVMMGYPRTAFVDEETDEWTDKDNPNAEKVISVTADN